MTVPNVVTGTQITSVWGNRVADDVNALNANVAQLNGLSIGPRLDNLESSLGQTIAKVNALGVRRSFIDPGIMIAHNQALPFRQADGGTAGITVSADGTTYTIQTAGIYAVQAFAGIEIRPDNGTIIVDLGGGFIGGIGSVMPNGGYVSVGFNGMLFAGSALSVRASFASTATVAPMTQGWLNIWRVAEGA